jgi:myo-inositol-1(or 4)-monophosphatase
MGSYVQTAGEIAREAGAIIAHFAARCVGFELKGEQDLVTEADRASEKLIVERLRTHFPSHSIVAEEGGGHTGSSGFRWYVDPLDGTTNFAHGFPVYNVTLALEKDGEVVAGVVFDPTRDEMFAAERGGGAFLNNRKISVSKCRKLDEALVATGFPSRRRHLNVNIHFYYHLAMLTHGVRRAGAAAIDLAYVACGRADAFWEFNLNPWDMAAGILLVEEAGGVTSDMRGGPRELTKPHLMADNGAIHAELLEVFEQVFRGEHRHAIPELGSDNA